ncbi:MAG: hypothetical protein FWE71_03730 [Nocardioidaceae bacterium]|nr:hypothetical protein [Nocardioidaceae bacterium]MCL2612929.1 hypothetical protein [Nocardioidaceae bacterium]
MPVDQQLLAHVMAGTGLTSAEATRLVEDVVAFHREPVADVVRRRHAELRRSGLRNEQIFTRLRAELAERVVAAPDLSERQLRRLIYS